MDTNLYRTEQQMRDAVASRRGGADRQQRARNARTPTRPAGWGRAVRVTLQRVGH